MIAEWYYQASELLFCWHAYSTSAASGLYLIALDYSVDSLLYGHTCAKALQVVPRSFPSSLLAVVLFFIKLVARPFVCAMGWYYFMIGRPCENDLNYLRAGALLYASYFFYLHAHANATTIATQPKDSPSKPTAANQKKRQLRKKKED
jgi:hypothetical protein